jgi:hypothetical protein
MALGALHPKCGSMRIFVFASLPDGSLRCLLRPAAGFRDSGTSRWRGSDRRRRPLAFSMPPFAMRP